MVAVFVSLAVGAYIGSALPSIDKHSNDRYLAEKAYLPTLKLLRFINAKSRDNKDAEIEVLSGRLLNQLSEGSITFTNWLEHYDRLIDGIMGEAGN